MTTRRQFLSVVGGAGLVVVASCGTKPPAKRKAAEPAKSPVPSRTPAGVVRDLAPGPEGAVFDMVTGLLAVAVREPTRLLLIEPVFGQVQLSIPIPGHARHLQLAAPGGPVLLPAEDANALLQVALPTGAITETAVGTYPHDAAQAADGTIVVADEMGGTLSIVRNNMVVRTVSDLTQPGGVTTVGDNAIAIDVGAFTVSVYDVVSGKRLARRTAGSGPTHIASSREGRVHVLDTTGGSVLTYGVPSLDLLDTARLGNAPYGVTYDDSRDLLWVSLTASNEVVGLSTATNRLKEVGRYDTVQQPNTVATDPVSGRIFVLSRTTGQLQVITP
ncbi:MAG: hypothetical protein ABI137_01540 [Antricoccus sp.]